MTDELTPIEPDDAVERYLDTRRDEVAETTYRSQKSRLTKFAEWCLKSGIDDLTKLSGRDLNDYNRHLRSQYRDEQGHVNMITLKTRLSDVRVFLRFCVSIDAVPIDFHEKVILPSVDMANHQRETIIEANVAYEILDALDQYRFGSKEHVSFAITWLTGCRLGVLHGLDVDDVDWESQYLTPEHRPETGTTLKNGKGGERVLAVGGDVLDPLDTYVTVNRLPMTDDHGREPLFTTRNGRASKGSIRNWIYRAQQPCYHSLDCPHGQDVADCEYQTFHGRKDCPSTTKPHDVRRGAITHFLRDDVPMTAVSDRCDVSSDVLEAHYDQRSEEGKAEQRREYFE